MLAVLEGSLSMVACVFFFGVQFLPAKWRETYAGPVFHWFMCNGGLFAGLIVGVAIAGEFPAGNLEGIAGGALIAISNTLLLFVKRSLGLFRGVVIYQAANLLTGYAIGRFGLFGAEPDPGRPPWVRDFGFIMLLTSLCLALLAKPDARARALSLSDPTILTPEEAVLTVGQNGLGQLQLVISEISHECHSTEAEAKWQGRDQLPKARVPALAIHGCKMVRSWSWPRSANKEPHDTGCVLLDRPCLDWRGEPASTAGSSSSGGVRHPDHGARSHFPSTGHIHQEDPGCANLYAADSEMPTSQTVRLGMAFPLCCRRRVRLPPLVFGMALAGFAGFCRGLNPLPYYRWRLKHPNQRKEAFVFPQALGLWAAGTVIYLSYASWKKVLHLPSPNHPHIRPAFISGCLWAAGFTCFAHSLDGLGFTAAYAFSSIGPVFLSQLFAMVVFREIQETRQLQLFSVCCASQVLGMAVIAVGT